MREAFELVYTDAGIPERPNDRVAHGRKCVEFCCQVSKCFKVTKFVKCALLYKNDIQISYDVRSECDGSKVFQIHGEAVYLNTNTNTKVTFMFHRCSQGLCSSVTLLQ